MKAFDEGGEKTLVIAKNLKYFWNHIQDRFKAEEIEKAQRNQGRVRLKTGEELIFISSNLGFRGYHGVNVVMWSVPDWYDVDETEALAKAARMS
jgi:inorganic pyrophosphatase